MEGERLVAGTTYQIVADSIVIGSAVAQSGYLRMEFSSDSSTGPALPPALRPAINIRRIEIRDGSGTVVLQGDFQTGSGTIGGDGSGGSGGGSGGGDNPGSDARFTGVIESLPPGGTLVGDWRVSGRIVRVLESTEIDRDEGSPTVGERVEVRGTLQSDGVVIASRIKVED